MALIYELNDETLSKIETKDRLINHKDKGDELFYNFLFQKEVSHRTLGIIEVLFRQLMMAEEFNTGFEYTDKKELKKFCGKMSPKERVRVIEEHISLGVKHKNAYGFNRLSIDKKDKIARLQVDLKIATEAINKLKKQVAHEMNDEEDFFGLQSELEKLHEQIITKKNAELNNGSHRGSKFITINKKGELEIDISKFKLLRFYSLIYYSLTEPLFRSIREESSEDIENASEGRMGLKGFIARKIIFEFQNRLGFKPDADSVTQALRATKTLNHIPEKINSMRIVDNEFFEHIRSLR